MQGNRAAHTALQGTHMHKHGCMGFFSRSSRQGTWLASTPALPRSAVLLSKRLLTCTARRQSSCHTPAPLSARFSLK